MPQDPNLPGGVTNRMIDELMGADIGNEPCPDCDGTGSLGSECCGVPVGDDGICPKCKEHAENEKCAKCNGTGEVTFDIRQRRREAREEAAEARCDQERDERGNSE